MRILTESFSMRNVRNITMFPEKISTSQLMRAVDGDSFTFVQSKETNVSLSITLQKKMNISCFTMLVRGGIKLEFHIYKNLIFHKGN
jgi:hypothetical protein